MNIRHFAIATIALLAVTPIAGASTIELSNVSSDFGEPTGSTNPGDLRATLDFQVSGSTLTLSVTNKTDANSSGNTFDITEVFFNTTANISSLSLASPLAAGDAGGVPTAPSGWDFLSGANADGFGSFDAAVKLFGDINQNTNIVLPGETEVLTFNFTCGVTTCDSTDFLAKNSNDYWGAAKFVNGPQIEDPEDHFGPDSAFGGAQGEGDVPPAAIPVPAAVWLFGSGLLGLVGVARRSRKA